MNEPSWQEAIQSALRDFSNMAYGVGIGLGLKHDSKHALMLIGVGFVLFFLRDFLKEPYL